MSPRLGRLAPFFLAALIGCAHTETTPDNSAVPAPAGGTSTAAPSANAAPAPAIDFMVRGRELNTLFWKGDAAAWHDQVSPSIRSKITVDQVQSANADLKSKLGGEKSMVSEQMTTFHGAPTYQRTFVCNTVADSLDFNVVFDPQGFILAYTVRPHGTSIIPGQ